MNSKTIAEHIAYAASKMKAKDIVIIDLRSLTSFTDYFVICSGTSDRQVSAIAETVKVDMKAKEQRPLGIEGQDEGRWVLVDYGDVVAHVFHEEDREFYELEKLWGDAPRVEFVESAAQSETA